MTDVSKIMEEAIHALERQGWTQGTICDEDGRLCAMGAFYTALGVDYVSEDWGTTPIEYNAATEDIWAAESVMVEYASARGYHGVAHWNDDPRRTREDVVMMFKELAAGAGEA